MPLTENKAVSLVRDVFTAAAERDIYTGDTVVISVIRKRYVFKQFFPLRKD